MNINPRAETLKIGDRRYRVYALDEKKLTQNEAMKNITSQYSYSGGGWKNIEEQTPMHLDDEDKLERRQKKAQLQQELLEKDKITEKQKQIQKTQFSHFISIPLATPLLIDQINQKKEELGNKYDDIFIDPKKAHLTITMLKLHELLEQDRCKVVLMKLRPRILGILKDNSNQNKVTIKKVNFFGESIENAKVVFLEIEKNKGYEIIMSIIDLICKTFIEEEIVSEEELTNIRYNQASRMYEQQQIHITVFKSRDNNSFNAKEIIDKFKDIEITNMKFYSLELSSILEIDENNYFKSIAKIQFE